VVTSIFFAQWVIKERGRTTQYIERHEIRNKFKPDGTRKSEYVLVSPGGKK
jgi:hypothetical protein